MLISPLEIRAPVIGTVFTAYSKPPKERGRDLRIEGIFDIPHTGYVKEQSPFWNSTPIEDKLYRFLVVDGPFTHTLRGNPHNHYMAIVFRELSKEELDKRLTSKYIVSSEDFLKMKRAALNKMPRPNFDNLTIQTDYEWLLQNPRHYK